MAVGAWNMEDVAGVLVKIYGTIIPNLKPWDQKVVVAFLCGLGFAVQEKLTLESLKEVRKRIQANRWER